MNDSAIIALEQALKLESDGRDFYLQASESAANPLVRAVLLALAEEELSHADRVSAIFDEVKNKKGWPDEVVMVAGLTGVVDAFERESYHLPLPSDLTVTGALKKALELETQSLEFYTSRAQKASCNGEAEFFSRLADEESVHIQTIKKALGQS